MVTVGDDESLRQWIVFVYKDDRCTCLYDWRQSLGREYGVGYGPGWVRVTTSGDCPHHGPTRLARRGHIY